MEDAGHARCACRDEGARPRYLLVGGSPEPSSAELVRALAASADRVVAVDRGAEVLIAAGVSPWAYVGDADSISGDAFEEATREAEVVRLHPVLKDATDLTLAFELAEEGGARSVIATCLTGGRLDHQLGVIGTLAAWARLRPELVEDTFRAWLLSPEGRASVTLDEAAVGATLSVLSLADPATVSEAGMRWDLDHHALALLDDLGVSNVVEAVGARVSCDGGRCLVVLDLPPKKAGS